MTVSAVAAGLPKVDVSPEAPSSGDGRHAAGLKARIERIRDALSEGLIERDIPIRLALLAALAGEHVLLIGPPGTAKSELARRLRLAFTGQTYFERLLTRFSVPEELFGPLSIKALEEDKYQRQTDGYLPTAAVAFLDEIFKANSAILNALLTLLNEREFDNGTQRIKTPLVSVVGASNELPQEEELLALYDRFLVRYHVGPVTDEGFAKLLDLRGQVKPAIDAALMLTPSDLEHIHAAAMKVTVSAEVASLLKAMRKHCQDQKIPVSDRRWRKALFLLQVAAHTDGRSAVSVWDCWLLQHCLWHKPEEITALGKWYEERAGAASPREPERFARVATAWEQRLREDSGKRVQKQNASGQLVFKDAEGRETTEKDRKDYYGRVDGVNDPIMEPIAFAQAHVDGRVSGVAGHMKEIVGFIQNAEAEADRLEATIRGHVWLDPAFAVRAVRNLHDHIKRATDARARLEVVKQGFQRLPVEDEGERLVGEPPPAPTTHSPDKLLRAWELHGDRLTQRLSFLRRVDVGRVLATMDEAGQIKASLPPPNARRGGFIRPVHLTLPSAAAQPALGDDVQAVRRLLRALCEIWMAKARTLNDDELDEIASKFNE
jgi:MoxR-like ATPase